MSKHILIIDDEKSICDSLTGVLTDEGYASSAAHSGLDGIEQIKKVRPDAVLLDIWMPEMDGIETLKLIKEQWPHQLVIVMSGHGTIETAVKATKLGAYDFIEKPLSLERLLLVLKNAVSAQDLARENDALRSQTQKTHVLLGDSKHMQNIRQLLRQIAPTTGSVLITGEHGTGKEMISHHLHALSDRFNRSFIEVNCAAIPEELIESELFGHEKGAFTGATQKRRGKFDLAHRGTLFLDEIGDMSLKTQAKVLRILQEQKFERVGGAETITVDVRIVAATNKDLKKEIQDGNFREDLYYRLNVVPFHVPPLRERKEDVPLLANHFLEEFSRSYQKKLRKVTPEGNRVLCDYAWPGNVRELKNLIERLMILTTAIEDGVDISAALLLEHLQHDGTVESLVKTMPESVESSARELRSLRDARSQFEKEFILKTLDEQGGNISKTASVLGIERSHLHRKIKSFGTI